MRPDTTRPDGSEAGDDDASDSGSDTGKSDADGGLTDADADVTPGKFMVVRVGDLVDAGTPGDNAAAVFLDEYDTTGTLLRTIAIPTEPAGDNYGFWLGSANITGKIREGLASLSGDGHYVVLNGYANSNLANHYPPSSGPPNSNARVLARIDSAGNVETTTIAFTPFSFVDIGGGTCNGTDCWMVGQATFSMGPPGSGVQYLTVGNGIGLDGGSPTHTDITDNTGPRNAAAIFDGQLYVSSNAEPPTDPDGGLIPGAPPPNGILKVGSGLPTASGATETVIATPLDAYSFAFLDLDGTAGVDTLYVATAGSISIDGGSTLGGVNKYTLNADAGTWAWTAKFADSLPSDGVRGLTAFKEGKNVVVVTTDSSRSTVVKYVDDGKTANPAGTVIATSPVGVLYTGVAQSPTP